MKYFFAERANHGISWTGKGDFVSLQSTYVNARLKKCSIWLSPTTVMP